jgi:hypothetical protein
MAEHSPEPWIISEYGRYLGGAQFSVCSLARPDRIVAECKYEEEARRIVACVNACKGLSTAGLEALLQQSKVLEDYLYVEDEEDGTGTRIAYP